MPTETQYTFTISTDFPNAKAAPDRLTREIQQSPIVIALGYIDTGGDVCDVWFKDVLSEEDDDRLSTLIAEHSGERLPDQAVDENGNPIVRIFGDSAVGLPVVQVLDIPDAANVLLKGYQIVVPANMTTVKDIHIGPELSGAQGRCYLAGGDYRVRDTNGHGAAPGSALHLAIVDRDNILGLFGMYGLPRTKISGLTDIVGTIAVGNMVTGATSGVTAKVLLVGSDYCEVTYNEGPFTDGESLSFSGGATAVLGSWEEGAVIEVIRMVKDEWIEDYDYREFSPGGSREVPGGMYFRIITFNAHQTDELRVKVGFTLGRL